MNILGITHSCYSANNAACLLINGKLIAFAEEERFIRKKHAPRIGACQATKYCLDQAGITIKDLDYIAVGFDDCPRPFSQILFLNQDKNRKKTLYLRKFKWNQPFSFKDPRVININHHISHLASSFYLSGFKQVNLISLDRRGESESGLLGYGDGLDMRIFHRVNNQETWGGLYEDITGLLGFKKHSQEGKTMGLASYGTPYPERFNFIDWNAKPVPKIDYQKKLAFLSKIKKRNRYDQITQEHKDLAATLQTVLEKAVLQMVKYLYQQTNSKNLCLAGGVALNCAMNGALLNSEYVDNIYIQPASSDAGTALGAATYVYVKKTNQLPKFVFNHAYWGPQFNDQEIEVMIKECKVNKYHQSENIFKEAAEKIAQDKIIGWFQGRMEAGPRALGNRSILANPANPKMKDMINKNVKKREPWRPFAPSILEEDAPDYVENYYPSPFMILAFKAKKDKLKDLIATAHVDETVRLQTVSKKTNSNYWKLINEFKKLTKIPAVLNTSYNLAGEPIVCTPRDALRTFYASGMDCLAIGNYLVEK